jgi:hypothetical protein
MESLSKNYRIQSKEKCNERDSRNNKERAPLGPYIMGAATGMYFTGGQ